MSTVDTETLPDAIYSMIMQAIGDDGGSAYARCLHIIDNRGAS